MVVERKKPSLLVPPHTEGRPACVWKSASVRAGEQRAEVQKSMGWRIRGPGRAEQEPLRAHAQGPNICQANKKQPKRNKREDYFHSSSSSVAAGNAQAVLAFRH